MIFIDTNIAIALRDGCVATIGRVADLPMRPVLSMMSRIELENGVVRDPTSAHDRRRRLDTLLRRLRVELFTEADFIVYRSLIERAGVDRHITVDRMIAAQAMARDALLITRNGSDFRSVEGLRLEEW